MLVMVPPGGGATLPSLVVELPLSVLLSVPQSHDFCRIEAGRWSL